MLMEMEKGTNAKCGGSKNPDVDKKQQEPKWIWCATAHDNVTDFSSSQATPSPACYLDMLKLYSVPQIKNMAMLEFNAPNISGQNLHLKIVWKRQPHYVATKIS
jgi:hypothetical protein